MFDTRCRTVPILTRTLDVWYTLAMKQSTIIVGILVLVVAVAAVWYTRNSSTPDTASVTLTEQPESSDAEPAITTETVTYHGSTSGYLARPDESGEYPAIILIHEWWGLNENIEQLARDFAAEGYVALAVDLYDGEVATTPDVAQQLAGAVRGDVDTAFANLEAARTYLAERSDVQADSLAAVGWCFGGGWAYEMAVNDLGIDASVMYYGQFAPEDDLSMMRVDILGHFGEEDSSIAVDTVREFEARLNTTTGDHAVFIYPNAGHAFANEDNEDAYEPEAAEVAWQRTLDFLARELRGEDRTVE